jgi:hypothetical protein
VFEAIGNGQSDSSAAGIDVNEAVLCLNRCLSTLDQSLSSFQSQNFKTIRINSNEPEDQKYRYK